MNLSLAEAQTIHLAAQGFLPKHAPPVSAQDLGSSELSAPPAPPSPRSPLTTNEAKILKTINTMGALQIDTISVVHRSPFLVLYSRLGSFDRHDLMGLLAKGYIFEYWSHAACFLPSTEFPWYRRKMLNAREDGTRTQAWFANHGGQADLAAHILQTIEAKGPLRSRDFATKTESATEGGSEAETMADTVDKNPTAAPTEAGWWNWKAEKIALEYLFDRGDLMVKAREGFQRVYDLQSRVLPYDDSLVPSPQDLAKHHVVEALRALGIVPVAFIADYFRQSKKTVVAIMADLLDQGLICGYKVQDFAEPWYCLTSSLPWINTILEAKTRHKGTVLLSPFDPVVWDRARLKALFGMDYTIEVYTPQAKRNFGYYSMPILHNGLLVGRLDPKAHIAKGIMEIKAIHLESWCKPTASLAKSLAKAIKNFALWHRTPDIILGTQGDQKLLELMGGLL